MTHILALDIAQKIGVCDWKVGERPRFYTVPVGDPEDDQDPNGWTRKSSRAIRWISTRMKLRDVDEVVIEAPVQGKRDTNAAAAAVTIGLFFSISGVVGLHSVGRAYGRVSTVRSHFLGRGNGNLKSEIAKPRVRQTCEAIGWSVANYDESDAGALAHWRAHQLGLGHLIPDVSPFHLRS
ncbi:MAG: hypothetical protein O9972_09670 [Burkholderiales bacterium]|nr:hypothetical protein [Burkholderiales bacterium]